MTALPMPTPTRAYVKAMQESIATVEELEKVPQLSPLMLPS